MSKHGLERLTVWRKALDFATHVYQKVLPGLPVEEKYALGQQIRRAAQSIPANIAEGHGRYYFLENVHFAYIARGSLEEVISHLSLAKEVGYLPGELYEPLIAEAEEILLLINGYITYLRRARQGEHELPADQMVKEDMASYSDDADDLDDAVK